MGDQGPRVRIVGDPNEAIHQLQARLAEEVARREAAEEELENLKKGSIAMMKYTASLARKKHDEELELLKQEVAELREQVDEARRKAKEASRVSAAVSTSRRGAKRDSLEGQSDDRGRRDRETRELEAYVAEQYAKLEEERKRLGISGSATEERPARGLFGGRKRSR